MAKEEKLSSQLMKPRKYFHQLKSVRAGKSEEWKL